MLVACAAIAVGCAAGAPLQLPEPTTAPAPATTVDADAAPQRIVRVAYPDVPATWAGLDALDTAATDLASLWALPLFRYDADGQLRPALATGATFPEVEEGWAVELSLAAGEWSDGTPVRAEDVVATVEALREARPGEWAALQAAEATGERGVRLTFTAPYGRWAHLLATAPGILPSRVLTEGGLAAYTDELPVVGGSYRLESFQPGRSADFVAHAGGPLGAPSLARVEVLFVPSYETALGLLDRGEVEVVLGHLALNPVGRAQELTAVEAAAPLGGTSVALEWEPGGALGGSAELRRAAADAIDVAPLVAGLLRGVGAPATSPIAGVEGPVEVATGRPRSGSVTIDRELVLVVPRWHEAVGFTARAVQRDLTAAGAATRLVAVDAPDHLEPVDPYDGALRIRRDPPRPPLGAEADAVAPGPSARLAEELEAAFDVWAADATATPLYRIGVAHAWRGIEGLEASSWPGLGFASAAEWRLLPAP